MASLSIRRSAAEAPRTARGSPVLRDPLLVLGGWVILAALVLFLPGILGLGQSLRVSVIQTDAPWVLLLPEPEPVTAAALALAPEEDGPAAALLASVTALPPAPDPALIARAPDSDLPLPVIGPAGERAWRHYAKPSAPRDGRPAVALVVAGADGLAALRLQLMSSLPPEASILLQGGTPLAPGLAEDWRRSGREVLLELPLQAAGWPREDGGPETLLLTEEPRIHLIRLRRLMASVPGAIGALSLGGGAFAEGEAGLVRLVPLLEELRQRGLALMISDEEKLGGLLAVARGKGLALAPLIRRLDGDADPARLQQALADLEALARAEPGGAAGVIRHPAPAQIPVLRRWAAGLAERGVQLVPVSALIEPDR